MPRPLLGLALCLLSGVPASGQNPAGPPRKALLIVNSQYQKLPPLPSPHLDAQVLETALRKTQFDVVKYEDNFTSLDQFENGFLKTVKAGDIVLVYYAGYAVQSGNDDFLLPVNYDPASNAQLVNTAFSLTRIQQDLEDQKAAVSIFMVDGAHEDKQLDQVATGTGLVSLQASGAEECFLFSAPLNQIAAPPPAGSPGALAAAVAHAIVKPDSSLDKLISDVVVELGYRPFASNQVTQPFFFTAPLPVKDEVKIVKVDTAVTERPQTNTKDREDYKFVPKGSFDMGCVPAGPCDAAEKPRHKVNITQDFWIGVTDVTVNAYKHFKAPPKQPFWRTEKDWSEYHPVVNVPWADAAAFCEWAGGRLPREAEWEYAARAGQADQIFPFDISNARDKANFQNLEPKGNDVYRYTSPVKSFDPNPWGLYDMAGNVWQWTADWFDASYYSSSPADDPKGPAGGKERVVRGGSFNSDPAKHLRISYRQGIAPNNKLKLDDVGFRCVLPDGPETRARLAIGQ
ncbi:MAG TPA: SUMF1/EgtB/PvdO family nonheme iron enzyme [Verrucomicrobiae bacterium]|nr:SUMF1/EgtB/PvdO family nonheme iron enzyme [Verrucomicrobiae bacterium]